MSEVDVSDVAQLAIPTDRRKFRNALGCFATGITIITARGPRDEMIGLTANSFNSVSMDPPLVLFSLSRSAFSLKALLSTDHFCINVLSDGQRALADRFARVSEDKWSAMEHEVTGTGCPVLPGCLATFECRNHHTYDGGDHVIFVGNVFSMRCSPDRHPFHVERDQGQRSWRWRVAGVPLTRMQIVVALDDQVATFSGNE